MISYDINLSGDNCCRPVAYSFHLEPADRDAMGRFLMPADELLGELPGANLARPELQSAMLAVM